MQTGTMAQMILLRGNFHPKILISTCFKSYAASLPKDTIYIYSYIKKYIHCNMLLSFDFAFVPYGPDLLLPSHI